ncbi:hypothetical protein RIF29_22011 [Crotalaria pallida]|uniref:Uncharacterized protein n=1 Tax=Crotalaria pallida TaxID=3830 RepID=A0AAN9I6F9_CROPI
MYSFMQDFFIIYMMFLVNDMMFLKEFNNDLKIEISCLYFFLVYFGIWMQELQLLHSKTTRVVPFKCSNKQ